jgi:hypothetical protein
MDVFGRFCNGPIEIHRLLQSLIIPKLLSIQQDWCFILPTILLQPNLFDN